MGNLELMPSSYDVVLLDDGNVNQILGIEESHFFDLKGVEIQPSKLTETISAFANASGGEIYVGIEEVVGETGKERHWKGFADQEAANGLIQTIESLSPLANHFSLLFLSNEKCEGVVVHLTIFKTKNIVSATNGKIYVRRGAQKLPVEGEIAIRRLKLDKGLVSFEDDTVTLDTT